MLSSTIFKKGYTPWNKNTSCRVNKICICGKTFRVLPADIRRGRGNFCSKPCAHSKERNKAWKGGVTPLNSLIRKSSRMREWRKTVFERDNYTCQGCGQVGSELQVDHIKSFADYPELRFDIDNGRTLCKPCHLKTPTWGFRGHPIRTG